MILRNLTPHVMRLGADGVEIPPEAVSARVATTRAPGARPGPHGTLLVGPATWGAVEGLPEAEEGVLLIVSGMVRDALGATRPDVVAPATGPHDGVIRREGQVWAVTRLVSV